MISEDWPKVGDSYPSSSSMHEEFLSAMIILLDALSHFVFLHIHTMPHPVQVKYLLFKKSSVYRASGSAVCYPPVSKSQFQ